MSPPSGEKVPDMQLLEWKFQLQTPQLKHLHKEAETKILATITANNLTFIYKHLFPETSTQHDKQLVNQMTTANETKIQELKSDIKTAEESEDDGQVVDAWTKLGQYYCTIGDLDTAKSVLKTASEKTASVGPKIDICFTLARMGFLYSNFELISKQLEKASQLIERGGDWERKNKYKTYKGIYLMSIRQFEEAADLLIDSFATFTCTELLSYESVVSYGVLCGALVLDRVSLKRKVVDSPEVLTLVPTTPKLALLNEMTNSLYTCDYKQLIRSLAEVEQQVLHLSPYVYLHSAYYIREMRCKAYSQILESYMSLNIKSMAASFGVSVEYLETDLARLIPQRKVNCVVDKVNGVIVTNRPDTKNAQYRQLISRGDALLTKLQKYGAAVRLFGSENL